MEELPWNIIRYDQRFFEPLHDIPFFQLEKTDNEKTSWCACGHTKDNTLTVACLPGLQYRFRVTAVNRIGDSDPLVSDVIQVDDGAMDSFVRLDHIFFDLEHTDQSI